MLLGYNTNGFAHHRIEDALEILAEIGYRSVAITLERDIFDPPDARGAATCIDKLRPPLKRLALRATIETGSRFILDPRHKHQPTLISAREEDRARRSAFLKGAIDLASALAADSVSLWSGAPDGDAPVAVLHERLASELRDLCEYAAGRDVRLAFEPEPGMLIQTMGEFECLFDAVTHPAFGLTLDAGHVHCLDDGDCAAHIRRWRDHLFNVHIEDMKRGAPEHLMFGEGDMDIPAVLDALRSIRYGGPVHVELSRHSQDAVRAAQRAFELLSPLGEQL